MIDHVSIAVGDLARATAFYDAVLAPLGHARVVERPGAVGYGKRYPELWLNERPGMVPVSPVSGVHLCLRARDAEAVAAFHAAALATGGTSDRAPGAYPGVMVTYHAAFVLDPDGNRIEAATFPRD
ncbi:MAG: VOC family protein [Pseudomonadota bacterium]